MKFFFYHLKVHNFFKPQKSKMNFCDCMLLICMSGMIFWITAPRDRFVMLLGIYVVVLLVYMKFADDNNNIYSICVTDRDVMMCHEFKRF